MEPNLGGRERSNRNYLVKMLVIPLIFDIFVFLVFLVYSILDKSLIFFLAFFLFILFILALEFFVVIKWTNRKLRQAFQSQSPKQLIAINESRGLFRWYVNMISKFSPGFNNSRVFSKAQAQIYWGEFDLAEEEMKKFSDQKLPPMYQALYFYYDALIQYLEMKDVQAGLKAAQEYIRLSQLPVWIPWRNWQYRDASSLAEIGEVIKDQSNQETITKLENKFPKVLLKTKILIAWALEKAYLKKGDVQKADQMRAFLTETAPYCKAFNREMGSGQPETV